MTKGSKLFQLLNGLDSQLAEGCFRIDHQFRLGSSVAERVSNCLKKGLAEGLPADWDAFHELVVNKWGVGDEEAGQPRQSLMAIQKGFTTLQGLTRAAVYRPPHRRTEQESKLSKQLKLAATILAYLATLFAWKNKQ